MPPSKNDVICCVPQCSSRANRKENISLRARPKCMILRTSTTCGNFFKYLPSASSGTSASSGEDWALGSGGGLRGGRVPTQMPPVKNSGGQKGH